MFGLSKKFFTTPDAIYMGIVTCTCTACDSRATTHFVLVSERRVTGQKYLCEQHARALIEQYRPKSGSYKATVVSRPNAKGVPFEIQALYSEEPQRDGFARCEIYLLQDGGSLSLPVETGIYELAALHRALRGEHGPRLPTHYTVADIIKSLRGRLDCVTLDKYIPKQRVYEATLHLDQENHIITVGARPSDAIILAVISGAPILVSPKVLMSFAK